MPPPRSCRALVFIIVQAALVRAWDPVPPCPAPFPASPVPETWCSQALATNPATGVTVSQFGLPANATLITVATNSSLWYDEQFFLGGGFAEVFDYMAGGNSRNESIIKNARTVPFIVRPLSPLASPPGWWLTSMLISTANYPEVQAIPPPNPGGPQVLEPLGAHTFATLDFTYKNPPGQPGEPQPPYFTYFLRCDTQLAAGLPQGWTIKSDSIWTPAWLFYNGQGFNGTWTSRCLAEVEPGAGALPASHEPAEVKPGSAAPVSDLLPAPAPAASAGAPRLPAVVRAPRPSVAAPVTAPVLSSSAAPDICAVLLEFETVAWGAWTPPHAPNTVIPDINGGTYGRAAMDTASGTAYMGTSADYPFFTLRIAAIDVATGASRTIGDDWPLPPPGFSGVNGLFFSLDFDATLGLVVGMTEISKYGPLPTRADEPGLPVGWTVIAAVDPDTSESTALTADLTPVLVPFPPIVGGLSALDNARGMLWLFSAAVPPPLQARTAPARAISPSTRSSPGPAAADVPDSFLGIQLSAGSSAHQAVAPVVLPTAGDGLVVTAFKYSSAADALVALEFNVTGIGPSQNFNLPPGAISLYPVNGSARTVVDLIPAGRVNPGYGQAEVSADGRYVYFAANQGEATLWSAALFTVDLVNMTVSLALAAPDDEYDVLALFKCV